MKAINNISGRTIQVADKGLNCGNNIMHALKRKDGYIFSKSVKTLPEKENSSPSYILFSAEWSD